MALLALLRRGRTARRRSAALSRPRLELLEDRLGHRFADRSLLERALTHPSLAGQRHGIEDYERLEFLGDRVLGLTVAHGLYRRFPGAAAGGLAVRFNALVRRDTVAEVARELELGPHLRLAAGEAQAGGAANAAILADALEAVFAALYLDGGAAVAERTIAALWAARIERAEDEAKDAKTRLQERLQRGGGALPRYRVVAQAGPDHAPTFTVEVVAEGRPAARGEGRSRRHAEQAAAAAMLSEIGEP